MLGFQRRVVDNIEKRVASWRCLNQGEQFGGDRLAPQKHGCLEFLEGRMFMR